MPMAEPFSPTLHGLVAESVKTLGLEGQTLVVVTSDHGEEFGERRPDAFYDRHGHSLYEELVHVPLVLRLPGGSSAGTRVESVSATVDIMPTILDVLGIAPQGKEAQGVTLRPRWEQGVDPGRRAWSEALAWGYEQKSVRSGSHKLIFTIDNPDVAEHGRHYMPAEPLGRELFDLSADPGETRNLVSSEQQVERAKELEALLREHQRTLRGDPERVELDEEAFERLRALGYVE